MNGSIRSVIAASSQRHRPACCTRRQKRTLVLPASSGPSSTQMRAMSGMGGRLRRPWRGASRPGNGPGQCAGSSSTARPRDIRRYCNGHGVRGDVDVAGRLRRRSLGQAERLLGWYGNGEVDVPAASRTDGRSGRPMRARATCGSPWREWARSLQGGGCSLRVAGARPGSRSACRYSWSPAPCPRSGRVKMRRCRPPSWPAESRARWNGRTALELLSGR